MVVGLLVAAVLAGCAEVDDGAIAAAPDFYSATVLPEGSYHCAGCHYGVDPVWLTEWQEVGSDEWDLIVRSAWPDVELVSVDVVAGNETPLVLDSGFIYDEFQGTWEYGFEVPAGASSLFVRFYTEQTFTQVGPTLVPNGGSYRSPTTLTLVAPDGDRIEVPGPEEELKQITLLGPAPGAWMLIGTVEDADATYRARAYIQAGAGQAAADLAFGDDAVFRFNGTTPPDVSLAIRPYHDHAPFEYGGLDWDYADSFVYGAALRTILGAAPAPYTWTTKVVDPFWDGAREVSIQGDRTFLMAAAYQEEGGTQREDTVTGKASSPYYYSPSDPVPPGTGTVRFELTWDPPVEEPDLQLRYGPAGTPYYRDAEVVERGAGYATFEAEWKSEWWDVRFVEGEPVLKDRGSIDIAPYIAADDGETKSYSYQVTLDAYAVRGAV